MRRETGQCTYPYIIAVLDPGRPGRKITKQKIKGARLFNRPETVLTLNRVYIAFMRDIVVRRVSGQVRGGGFETAQ